MSLQVGSQLTVYQFVQVALFSFEMIKWDDNDEKPVKSSVD